MGMVAGGMYSRWGEVMAHFPLCFGQNILDGNDVCICVYMCVRKYNLEIISPYSITDYTI